MNDFEKVLEDKFGEALQLYGRGNRAVLFRDTPAYMKYEIIALDSLRGPSSRCVISRKSLDSPNLIILGQKMIAWGSEIPRERYDDRIFEEVMLEGVKGEEFRVTENEQKILVEGDIRQAWKSAGGLAIALSRMRVVPNIPTCFS